MKITFTSLAVCLSLGLVGSAKLTQAASIQLSTTTLDVSIDGTAGLGFTFTNDSSGYAVFDQTSLTQQTLGFGSYTDLVGNANLVVVAPGASVTETFNAMNGSGAGQYTFFNTASTGTTIDAILELDYDVYSVSPSAPTFDAFADYLTSTNVSEALTLVATPATSPVPEPGSLALLAIGLLGAFFRRRRT